MQTLSYCSIVMHIHDEVVIEADPSMSLDAVCEQMGRTPPWAKGLLLRADGYATPFYKKDQIFSAKRQTHLHLVVETENFISVYIKMRRPSPMDIRDGRPFSCPFGKEEPDMSISKYNSEGYLDPTAYDALSSIENEARALRAFRSIVYVCSPYAGDIEKNIAAARTYSRFAVEQGYIPIAPHLLFPQFLNDTDSKERELGLFFGNAIMSKCSEVWVFESHISSGMEAEVKRTKWKNYHLRYFTENLEEI